MSDTPKASDQEELPLRNEAVNEAPINETSATEISVEAQQKATEKKTPNTNLEVSETSRKHFKYRSNECLNCGQPLDLSDRYCPYCSQLNSTKQLSFGDFFREFFSSLVSYDSRLWFTLKHLLFKPGTITKRYVEGHRLRYANPFRFFLSVSIIYFLLNGVLNFIMPSNDFINNKDDSSSVKNKTVSDTKEDLEELQKDFVQEVNDDYAKVSEEPYISNPDWENEVIQSLGNDSMYVQPEVKKPEAIKIPARQDTTGGSEEKREIPIEKDTTKTKSDTVTTRKKATPIYATEEKLQEMGFMQRNVERFSTYNEFWEDTDITNSGRALDSLNHPPTRFNLWLYEKNNSVKRIQDDPEKFINYLAGKVPFFLFFFAPFFALFFWLIYSKKKYSYMEHLVFIFHIFSFMFLSLLILAIPKAIFDTDIFTGILFLLIGPFYLYKALRNFYRQSRIITILKFVFLNTVFGISASIATALFLAITAATY